MTCFPDEVNWNNKEFTKEMLDYLRAVYCVHPMVLDALDYINSLESRIAELEAERHWIPVSERLPEIDDGDVKDYDVVLAYRHRRAVVIVAKCGWDDLDKTQRRWFDCDSDEWGPSDITEYVTHWRERPAPPEVQE